MLLIGRAHTQKMRCYRLNAWKFSPTERICHCKLRQTESREVNTALASKQDKETQNSSQTPLLLTATARTLATPHTRRSVSISMTVYFRQKHVILYLIGEGCQKIESRLQTIDRQAVKMVCLHRASEASPLTRATTTKRSQITI